MVYGIFLTKSKYSLDLLALFHMSDCKPSLTPCQSEVKLTVNCESPLVEATLYHQIVGSLIYLTHNMSNLFVVASIVSRFMQKFDQSLGNKIEGFSDIFKELSIMVFSILIRLLFHFLVISILIGQEIPLTNYSLQDMYFNLVQFQFHCPIRSWQHFLFLIVTWSIWQLRKQLKKQCRSRMSLLSLD